MDMYDIGFNHGVEDAVLCCFGGSKRNVPWFDTPDEEFDYFSGYQDGYNSVDLLS